jgi:hypothetical protein
MAEIAGAREQLDEAATWLGAQIRTLAGHLTPGHDPDVYMPSDPMIVDWHEPLKYQYRMSGRVDRPAEQYDPTVVTRAVELLGGAGWDVGVEVAESATGGQLTTVVASRDGYRLTVRIEEGYGTVVYSGETPTMALFTSEPFVRPDPVLTPETVRRGYLLCYECDGFGWCPVCEGRGWTLDADGRERCVECLGSKYCPVCRGAGELEAARLQDWQRDQYPELREQS